MSLARLAAGIALAAFVVGASRLPAARAQSSFVPRIPKGLPADLWQILVPAGNPVTEEKIALGRKLFFDTRLSKDGTISCATCHDPAFSFADRRAVAEGVLGRKGTRNTPSILNAAFGEFQFWDGRATTLEEQAKTPLVNPDEMGFSSHDEVLAVVNGQPDYRDAFRAIFGRAATIDDVAAAIATFERTLLSGDSPFDRFIAGDRTAMSESAQRGFGLWNTRARCHTCHPFSEVTPNFTDNKFHNIGVGWGATSKAFADVGRYAVTRQPRDRGSFKTPGLRDVALTPPYMHDGSQKTLHDVVTFYDLGGEPNPYLDPNIVPLRLAEREKADLLAFMNALTGANRN